MLLHFLGHSDLAARARQQRLMDVAQRYHQMLVRYTVLPPDGTATVSHDSSTIVDTVGDLHRIYGVRDEALFLVRPDGYLAYCGEPAEPERLVNYLARLFKPRVGWDKRACERRPTSEN